MGNASLSFGVGRRGKPFGPSSYEGLIDFRLGNIPRYYFAPREDFKMRVPEEVRQCVIFLGMKTKNEHGQEVVQFIGTAFFVAVPSELVQGWGYTYLVTAKHVALALKGGPFIARVNTNDGSSAIVEAGTANWVYHPEDNAVDVAVIQWNVPPQVEYRKIPSDMFVTEKVILEKNIGPGDEVFITGLFAHVSGRMRNLPLVRMGNVALFPSDKIQVLIGEEWYWVDAYLIEARSIGGISGSPVFVRLGFWRSKDGQAQFSGNIFYLLGLMHRHWEVTVGKKNDLVQLNEDVFGAVNLGIAIVVPAYKILEVLNQPNQVEYRRKLDEEELRRRQPMPVNDKDIISSDAP